jgi:hypothetical protein
VINELLPSSSGLHFGDCVVAVDGRLLEDLVRSGPVRIYDARDVLHYDVRRSGAPFNRDCSGPLSSIDVTLTTYRFRSVLGEHSIVLALVFCLRWVHS